MTANIKAARNKAWKRQKGQCFYCNKSVAKHRATLDHLIPKCEGGIPSEGVMACYDCNQEKANMPAAVFLEGEEAREAWRRERASAWRERNALDAAREQRRTELEFGIDPDAPSAIEIAWRAATAQGRPAASNQSADR